MKNLVIIGGAAPDKLSLLISSYASIIAADSGYDTAKRLGITPDVVLGDFDSTLYREELLSSGYEPCPRDKDDTDAAMAIKASGDDFDLIGGGEGRIDHTLSLLVAFRTIAFPRVWYMRSDTLVSVSSHISFKAPVNTDVSIIPLTSSVVTTSGLFWDIKDVRLSDTFISQSNRVMNEEVSIDVSDTVFLRFFPEEFRNVEIIC